MCFSKLSKREQHIKLIFLPKERSQNKEYLPEKRVIEIVKAISDIGNRYGFVGEMKNKDQEKSSKRSHKYDVWIAKEIKKNTNLINCFEEIRLILDWAIQTKANIFSYSFESAYVEQNIWHKELFKKHKISPIDIKDIDNKRILFRCSNQLHFIYILKDSDLEYEGLKMKMCVGGKSYKDKVKHGRSTILSIRDEKNEPHVTMEIDNDRNNITQIYGKGNSTVKEEYRQMILEFLLFATDYENLKNKNLIKLMNLEQTL
jgi:hypothetical protein